MPRFLSFSLFSPSLLIAAIISCGPICVLTSPAKADTFGSGVNAFEIDFVTIGDPGNAADTTGDPNPAGAVPYVFRMGTFEISEAMIQASNAQSAAEGDPLNITIDTRGPDMPATRVSWFEAARFVNWLNTSTGHTPAYNFDSSGNFQLWEPTDAGYNPDNLFRNSQAHYFIPSADEWYKAAFYDPATDQWFDYPNGMNTPPLPVASGTDPNTAIYNQAGPANIMLAGGPSPFGTVGQAGNVWEWDETAVDLVNDDPLENRGFRGAAFLFNSGDNTSLSSSFRHFINLPSHSIGDTGFRIASTQIPEPSTIIIATIFISLALSIRALRPARLQSGISIFALLAFLTCFAPTPPANAATIFESGTLGPVGVTQGDADATNVHSRVFTGVRFELTTHVLTTQVGGHFQGNSSFFGAIIELSNENDFPDSGDFTTPDFLGAAMLEFPSVSDEVFGDLSLSLEPGWYALVFGSGFFETQGSGAAIRNNPDIDGPAYIAYQPFVGWFDLSGTVIPFDNHRFVVNGHIVPEPSSLILFLLVLPVVSIACRNKR